MSKNNVYITQLQEIKKDIESLPGSYRFLYTKPKSISSPYIFVGLNPGGTVDDPSDLYVEEDNAYVHEKWNKTGKGYNPLQQQVIYFFQQMTDHLGHPEWIRFMSENWLISNYVFYRSSRWPEMASKKNHIANSKAIWKKLFSENNPKIIIANGYDTYDNMILLLAEAGWSKLSETKTARAWDGPHISVLQKESHSCLIIGFAHLSTFKIIKRPENKAVMENIYKLIKKYY